MVQHEKVLLRYVKKLHKIFADTYPLKHLGKRVFSLPPQDSNTSMLKCKYDKVQRELRLIAAMDDLLSGKRLINEEIIIANFHITVLH